MTFVWGRGRAGCSMRAVHTGYGTATLDFLYN